MSFTPDQIHGLMHLIGITRESELNCNECLHHVAEFAECELTGKKVPEALEAVRPSPHALRGVHRGIRRVAQGAALDGDIGVNTLLARIRACAECAAHLPLGPRPVIQAHPSARLLIIGQAPGARVHESGVPWMDASGRQLRAWLGIDDITFYDASKVALMPMGFCYPGKGEIW